MGGGSIALAAASVSVSCLYLVDRVGLAAELVVVVGIDWVDLAALVEVSLVVE